MVELISQVTAATTQEHRRMVSGPGGASSERYCREIAACLLFLEPGLWVRVKLN